MKKQLAIIVSALTAVVIFSCTSGDSTNPPVLTPLVPQVTTAAASSITTNAATSGGNVIAIGASPITVRGVVWDVNPSPTIALNTKTINGEGLGVFTASLTSLNSGTEYYIRAYVTNSQGTFYGNENHFTTLQPTLVLGQNYKGGIIAYFLKSGDPGYSASTRHGLIVNPTDTWYAEWGCFTLIGNTLPGFGQGLTNSQHIIAGPSCTSEVAAHEVDLSTYGGYSDWYLPSQEELSRIWHNWDIGSLPPDLFVNSNYWTSTEYSNQQAYIIVFETGLAEPFYKYNSENICAVRAF